MDIIYARRIASLDAALRLAQQSKQSGRPPRAGDIVVSAKVFLTYLETGQ